MIKHGTWLFSFVVIVTALVVALFQNNVIAVDHRIFDKFWNGQGVLADLAGRVRHSYFPKNQKNDVGTCQCGVSALEVEIV